VDEEGSPHQIQTVKRRIQEQEASREF